MNGRRARLIALVALVMVIGVGVWIFMGVRQEPRPSALLLDGTRITMQRWTQGTNHYQKSTWFGALMNRLPATLASKLHWQQGGVRGFSTTEESWIVWLTVSRNPQVAYSIEFMLADENGLECGLTADAPEITYTPSGFRADPFGFTRGSRAFPRGSSTFALRLYQRDSSGVRRKVAEFPIVAVPRAKPAWLPQKLPIEVRTNGYEFTLIKAVVGTSSQMPVWDMYAKTLGQWEELRLRVTAGGQIAKQWRISEMRMSDQSGNHSGCLWPEGYGWNGEYSGWEGDEIICLHHWNFWSDQPAWQLKMHFVKSTLSTNAVVKNAEPSELWIEYLVRPEFLDLPRHDQPVR